MYLFKFHRLFTCCLCAATLALSAWGTFSTIKLKIPRCNGADTLYKMQCIWRGELNEYFCSIYFPEKNFGSGQKWQNNTKHTKTFLLLFLSLHCPRGSMRTSLLSIADTHTHAHTGWRWKMIGLAWMIRWMMASDTRMPACVWCLGIFLSEEIRRGWNNKNRGWLNKNRTPLMIYNWLWQQQHETFINVKTKKKHHIFSLKTS